MARSLPRPAVAFWTVLIIAFGACLSYPIGMAIAVPGAWAFRYARHDLAWSFHALFLVPIAFGLLAAAVRKEYFLSLSTSKRLVSLLLFLAPLAFIYWAAILDAQVIPSPDRVSDRGGLQAAAIDVDRCLRTEGCPEAESYLDGVATCREEYSSRFRGLTLGAGIVDDAQVQSREAAFARKHAYFCALLEQTDGQDVQSGPMVDVILVLKMVLITFVWSFIYYTIFLALNFFGSVREGVLYPLLGCYVLLVTWFPLQLYAEWYQWYGDFLHITSFNASFWVLLVVAVLLLVLFAAWIYILLRKANIVVTIAAVHSILIAVFTVIFSFNPEFVGALFQIFLGLDDPIFVALMFVVLLYLAVYINLLLKWGEVRRETSGS